MSTRQLELNLGKLNQAALELKKASKRVVSVGLPADKIGSKIYKSGAELLLVAFWHEYGTVKMPERSWMRVPLRQNAAKLAALMKAEYGKIQEGDQTVDGALDKVGMVAANLCKASFRTRAGGVWPDITERTKKAKGSSAVLIDTGLLRSSITWQVGDAGNV